MNDIIKSLREETAKNEKVQKEVKNFIEEAKEAAANGKTFLSLSCGYDIENAVLNELYKLGFRRYTKRVEYWGVVQYGTFITWMD